MGVSPTSLSNRYHIRFNISWVSHRFIIIAISSVSVYHRWQLYRYFMRSSSISVSDLHLMSFRLSSASHSYLIGVLSVDSISNLIGIDVWRLSVSDRYRWYQYLIGLPYHAQRRIRVYRTQYDTSKSTFEHKRLISQGAAGFAEGVLDIFNRIIYGKYLKLSDFFKNI